MRVIDADELLRRWDELTNRSRMEFDQVIMLMPTAYDVYAVVERLETEDSKIEIQYEYNYEKGLSDGIGKAIEIVKAGGKNDD